jgi:rod shape-determining protein MreD
MPADAAKAAGLLFLVVVVQLSVMANVDILGGHPNLLLVTVVCVSLLRGAVFGAVAGFSAGLLADTGVFGTLGFTALLLTLAGYWTGRYGETSRSSRSCIRSPRSSCVTCSASLRREATSSPRSCRPCSSI